MFTSFSSVFSSLFFITFFGITTTIPANGGQPITIEESSDQPATEVQSTSPMDETEFQANADLNEFVTCLADKKVTFYGAFWCPHCQNQKKIFGEAAENLPYVECSTPDGNGQTQVCIDAKIRSYPTWVFGEEVVPGEHSLEELSAKTGCGLPADL